MVNVVVFPFHSVAIRRKRKRRRRRIKEEEEEKRDLAPSNNRAYGVNLCVVPRLAESRVERGEAITPTVDALEWSTG